MSLTIVHPSSEQTNRQTSFAVRSSNVNDNFVLMKFPILQSLNQNNEQRSGERERKRDNLLMGRVVCEMEVDGSVFYVFALMFVALFMISRGNSFHRPKF
jgi:hypothetical protein